MPPHDPIDPKYYSAMKAVAEHLKMCFPGAAFALMVFDKEDPSKMNYISNAERQEMLNVMKEYIARCEGPDIPTTRQ